jgi:hypothetical protein
MTIEKVQFSELKPGDFFEESPKVPDIKKLSVKIDAIDFEEPPSMMYPHGADCTINAVSLQTGKHRCFEPEEIVFKYSL